MSGVTWSGVSLAQFNQRISSLNYSKYLFQEVEKNVSPIKEVLGEQLAVVRCVTFCHHNRVATHYAYIQIKYPDNPQMMVMLNIDIDSGLLEVRGEWNQTATDFMMSIQPNLSEYFGTIWSDLRQLCENVHGLFSDTFSIGWDVAMTDRGPVIIEGNTHWGFELPQELSVKSLLSGQLRDALLERVAAR